MIQLRDSMKALLIGAALVLVLGTSLLAQDYRGSILGTVTDSTGAVLPGATVTVTNTATNVAARDVVTDARGLYQVRFLISGIYAVRAQLDGLKTVHRPGIQVRVGDAVTIDLTMEAGGISEVIEVKAEQPLLNVENGTSGQVIDSDQIRELPLGDGTAYMLTRLSPGIIENSDLKFSRPMDNANLAGIVANGVQGGNDFTLDGAPNIVTNRSVGFSPPSEAIQEFKVETTAFDAGHGYTAGAVVNLALKSGMNAFHGSASYFNRSDSRSADSLVTLRAGEQNSRDYDRFSATLAGPLVKDKTFFMVGYESLNDLQSEPRYLTVPTEKMRQGDFSELLSQGIVIYDPKSLSGGKRTPFPNNQIPADRLDPIGVKIASYYPQPNYPGKADYTNNYFSKQDRTYDYDALLGRLDHNIGSSQRLFLTAFWNHRTEDRYDWAGEVNGYPITKGADMRTNVGGILGYTWSISGTLVADVRASYQKFTEDRDPVESFDPASLGFSGQTLAQMNGYDYFPSISTTGFAQIPAQRSDYNNGMYRPFQTYSLSPSLTKMKGGHTLRAGYGLRVHTQQLEDAGMQGGAFSFGPDYTRETTSSGSNKQGQGFAALLLGQPTGGNIDANSPLTYDYSMTQHAFYVQDDWRASRKLTVNVGLRFEIEQGMKEKDNHSVGYFDTTVSNPLEAQAQAKYAAKPMAELPASQFKVPGGYVYATGRLYDTTYKVLPRANVSYLITPKTVFRAGAGLFSYPYFMDAINTTGYSLTTNFVASTDSGATFVGNLANPYPNGLATPPGSSQGLLTNVGQSLTRSSTSSNPSPNVPNYLVPTDRESPQYLRWQASLQRDLGKGWVLQLDYLGSRGSHLAVARNANALPGQWVKTNRARDAEVQAYESSFLNTKTPNPFEGLLPGSSNNGSTINKNLLLVAYPQFGSNHYMEEYTGSDSYNAGQLRLQRRFTNGSSLVASYTYSSAHDKLTLLNQFDAEPTEKISENDRPHRVTIAGVGALPFGRDRKWGSNWNGLMDAVLGGWMVSANYQYQSGQPITWSHAYFDPNVDLNSVVAKVGEKDDAGQVIGFDVPAWDTSGFYFHDAAVQTNGVDDPAKQRGDPRINVGSSTARYFPRTVDSLRTRPLHLLDVGIYKNFNLPRSVRLQIRVEALNALNFIYYWDWNVDPTKASFGYFTGQRNNPRDIQLGARLTF